MQAELLLLYVSRWSSKHMCIHACWRQHEVTQCIMDQKPVYIAEHIMGGGSCADLKGSSAELSA